MRKRIRIEWRRRDPKGCIGPSLQDKDRKKPRFYRERLQLRARFSSVPTAFISDFYLPSGGHTTKLLLMDSWGQRRFESQFRNKETELQFVYPIYRLGTFENPGVSQKMFVNHVLRKLRKKRRQKFFRKS